MKIALLNDTHFGVRNDSEAFRNYQLGFYNEIFFPYLQENNIKTLVHLGDVPLFAETIGYVNTANAMKWCHLSEPGASIF